jgi:hypothetical protein
MGKIIIDNVQKPESCKDCEFCTVKIKQGYYWQEDTYKIKCKYQDYQVTISQLFSKDPEVAAISHCGPITNDFLKYAIRKDAFNDLYNKCPIIEDD